MNVHVPAKFVRSFTRVAFLRYRGYFKTLGSPWIRRSRSLILAPIESAYATSYQSVIVILVLSCTVSEILQFFVLLSDTTPIPS